MASRLGINLGQNRCPQAGGKILSPTVLLIMVLAARGKVPLDRCKDFFHHEGSKALKQVLRQAVGFLALKILQTQLNKAR